MTDKKDELDMEIARQVAEDRKRFNQFLAEIAEDGAEGFEGAPTLAMALLVSEDGTYYIKTNNFSTSSPVIYQAIGLLEQMKLDLLASVPRNRPLREPDGEDHDELPVASKDLS